MTNCLATLITVTTTGHRHHVLNAVFSINASWALIWVGTRYCVLFSFMILQKASVPGWEGVGFGGTAFTQESGLGSRLGSW